MGLEQAQNIGEYLHLNHGDSRYAAKSMRYGYGMFQFPSLSRHGGFQQQAMSHRHSPSHGFKENYL